MTCGVNDAALKTVLREIVTRGVRSALTDNTVRVTGTCTHRASPCVTVTTAEWNRGTEEVPLGKPTGPGAPEGVEGPGSGTVHGGRGWEGEGAGTWEPSILKACTAVQDMGTRRMLGRAYASLCVRKCKCK